MLYPPLSSTSGHCQGWLLSQMRRQIRDDELHPPGISRPDPTCLSPTHILRQSLLIPPLDASGCRIPSSLDILKDFANLSATDFDGLLERIESPENAFMLVLDWHASFDFFPLVPCSQPYGKRSAYPVNARISLINLVPTETSKSPIHPKPFKVCSLSPQLFVDHMRTKPLTFVKHAPRDWAFSLPMPKFLGIHAAIAHVLHKSGVHDIFCCV